MKLTYFTITNIFLKTEGGSFFDEMTKFKNGLNERPQEGLQYDDNLIAISTNQLAPERSPANREAALKYYFGIPFQTYRKIVVTDGSTSCCGREVSATNLNFDAAKKYCEDLNKKLAGTVYNFV